MQQYSFFNNYTKMNFSDEIKKRNKALLFTTA